MKKKKMGMVHINREGRTHKKPPLLGRFLRGNDLTPVRSMLEPRGETQLLETSTEKVYEVPGGKSFVLERIGDKIKTDWEERCFGGGTFKRER